MVTTHKNKISILLTSLEIGGVERILLTLAKGFVSRGYDIDLVVGCKEGNFFSLIPPEVRLFDLKIPYTSLRLPSLVHYLNQERPAMFLSAKDGSNLVSLWAKRFARIKPRLVISSHVIWSTHAHLSSSKSLFNLVKYKIVMPYLMRVSYPLADEIVAVSHAVAKDLANIANIPLDRINVIYNPVVTDDLVEKSKSPITHEWFTSDQLPVILGVGRLCKEKDFATLIRAFVLVRREYPSRLVILGDGEERSMLESLINDLHVQDSAAILGFVENPYAYMHRASVFVLSSLSEALSTVLIEALATGTPVVSTDCPGGTREILKDGMYGPLVPVRNAATMAKAILTVLNRPHSSELLQQRAQDFSLQKSVDHYLKILRNF